MDRRNFLQLVPCVAALPIVGRWFRPKLTEFPPMVLQEQSGRWVTVQGVPNGKDGAIYNIPSGNWHTQSCPLGDTVIVECGSQLTIT